MCRLGYDASTVGAMGPIAGRAAQDPPKGPGGMARTGQAHDRVRHPCGRAGPSARRCSVADMDSSNTHSNDAVSDTGVPSDTTGGADAAQTGEVIGADAPSSLEKDPHDWVTGDEPMTGAQRSYLDTLAREAGETLPADLNKAEASEHIDRLQQSTGRGADTRG